MNKIIISPLATCKTINANNVEIWTEIYGHENPKAIILIAGAMAPAVFYPADFCKKLTDLGYKIIRFDNRDIGYSSHFLPAKSENETPPYSIADMVEDLNSVLTSYGVEKAILIGHSLGSSIAQLFAIKYPQKTEQLFLLSSPIIAFGNNEYTPTSQCILTSMWKVLMSNRMYQDYDRGKDEFFRVWKYLNGSRPFDIDLAEEYTKRLYETETIDVAYNHVKIQNAIADVYDSLAKLPFPLHFIYGENDYLAASAVNIEILANSLPNADFALLKGAGHMYFNKTLWQEIFDLVKQGIYFGHRPLEGAPIF
jgi:pimeloyl-ACP methyl ester carboxylesterase